MDLDMNIFEIIKNFLDQQFEPKPYTKYYNSDNNYNAQSPNRQKEITVKDEFEDGIISKIKYAIQENLTMSIEYRSAYNYSGGEITNRIIHPMQLLTGEELNEIEPTPNNKGDWIEGTTYLKAFCQLRNEERTFRVDRIISIKFVD